MSVAYLATLGKDGFPHVTPIWFVWEDGAFYMTSLTEKAHVGRLERDPRASICVEVEEPERADGERPNRSVRATGPAECSTTSTARGRGASPRSTSAALARDAMVARRAEQDRV